MKINDEIVAKSVRLVTDASNEVMHITKALSIASDKNLDLVQMSDGDIPVVKIMDYNKFLYDTKKNKVKPKNKPTKEIRFTPNIGDNDVDFKTKHIIEFLNRGHKVKIVMTFRGREITHLESGQLIILKILDSVSDVSAAEYAPIMEGDKYHVTIRPKKQH